MKELEVELICANSPQAKGRVERMFNTLQDRLVKEMRLRKISSMEKGNRYLEDYIKEHNTLFAVTPENSVNKHRPCKVEMLDEVLCYKENRKESRSKL